MSFAPDGQTLVCNYCTRDQTLGVGTADEKDFIVAMATARGHGKPLQEQVFHCNGCSAEFILPPKQISASCVYCDSPHVVSLEKTKDISKMSPKFFVTDFYQRFAIEEDSGDIFNNLGINPKLLKKCTGIYEWGGGELNITLENEHLFLQYTGEPKFPLTAINDSSFLLAIADKVVTFKQSSNGNVGKLMFQTVEGKKIKHNRYSGYDNVKNLMVSLNNSTEAFIHFRYTDTKDVRNGQPQFNFIEHLFEKDHLLTYYDLVKDTIMHFVTYPKINGTYDFWEKTLHFNGYYTFGFDPYTNKIFFLFDQLHHLYQYDSKSLLYEKLIILNPKHYAAHTYKGDIMQHLNLNSHYFSLTILKDYFLISYFLPLDEDKSNEINIGSFLDRMYLICIGPLNIRTGLQINFCNYGDEKIH